MSFTTFDKSIAAGTLLIGLGLGLFLGSLINAKYVTVEAPDISTPEAQTAHCEKLYRSLPGQEEIDATKQCLEHFKTL